MTPPKSLTVRANEVDHHVLEWSCEAPRWTAVLLHGFMDAAATWDRVAPDLASAGFRVLAPDLRGFGNGHRIGPGASYYFPDYLLDVLEVLDALVGASPVLLVGHSMGGTITSMFAGVFPERVRRIVVIEGFGPPDNPHEVAPDRMRHWADDMRRVRAKRAQKRDAMTFDNALSRLAMSHPKVDRAILATRIPQLTRTTDDGLYEWLFDPLHRTSSPVPFYAKSYKAFASRVAAPALLVVGGADGYHPPDEDERLSAFRLGEKVEIPDSGHMVHWTHPEELTQAILRFWEPERVADA